MKTRSIPPITSSGNNRRKTSIRFEGLDHISISRYMSIRRKSESEDDSRGITKYSKSIFNTKPRTKSSPAILYKTDPKVEIIRDMSNNYKDDGNFEIILQFRGFEFLDTKFHKAACKASVGSYNIRISYKEIQSRLYLTIAGNRLHYKFNQKVEDQLYGNEISIPELLLQCNSLSMNDILKNNWIIITY